MRFIAFVIFATVILRAAPQAEDPDVMRARLNIARLRALADAGAVPRVEVEKAEDALGDAQDLAMLRRTMSITDLTEEQANQMVTAAENRLQRRQKQLDKMRGLVDSGLAAQNELQPFKEQSDFAHNEYDLAVSRARICHDLVEMVRAEQARLPRPSSPAEGARDTMHFDGAGTFSPAQFQQLSAAYERRFSKPLPVSAMGETAVHRALGFDHRGRVDVAVSPDTAEGAWLRQYLETQRIPYFAFWHAVAGKATGAHIHIGPESTRLTAAAD
jgi:hypothetical protein